LRDNDQYKITFKDWYLSAHDDKGFIEKIKKLSQDKKYYAESKKKSSQIALRYDTKTVMKQINSIYDEALEKNK
jgi:hypothetical protein